MHPGPSQDHPVENHLSGVLHTRAHETWSLRPGTRFDKGTAHAALDRSLWDADGWPADDFPAEVEEVVILSRVLALNGERSRPRTL